MPPTAAAQAAARAAWRVSPAGYGLRLLPDFQLWRHTAAISRAFVWALTTPDARLIINVPPQWGKSMCTSHAGPVWALDHWPHLRLLFASYGYKFASTWGAKVRDTIVDNPEHLRVRIVGGRSAGRAEWHTTAGGGMFCDGAGGGFSGRPADAVLIDDPHKNWAEAHSEIIQIGIWEWWMSIMQARLQPGASAILTTTRLAEGDLPGRLTDPKQNPDWASWRVLRLPALAEADDPLGRAEGEVLDPRRFTREQMEARKAATSSYIWAGVYQQSPAPAGGGIFRRGWWRYIGNRRDGGHLMPPLFELDDIIQSWDMSFKGGDENDYVVGQVWGRHGADIYLLDQVREQMDFPATVAAMRNLTAKWPTSTVKLVEDTANGPAVISTLQHQIGGIIPVTPEGSKEARAHAVSYLVEAGNVYLPNMEMASWIMDFIEECAIFPNGAHDDHGAHDDQVDAMTQALRRLSPEAAGWTSDYGAAMDLRR